MCVHVGGRRDLRVAEDARDHAEVLPILEKKRRACVAEVVEPLMGKARIREVALECLGDVPRVERRTVARREDEITVDPSAPRREAVLKLSAPMLTESGRRLRA